METDSEYSESSSITFEWTLKGLKNLFDATKGDKKSKVTKSIRFGNNRWQILFYANAGQTKEGTEGGFVSLYLSCEKSVQFRWVRDGVYKFSFELRDIGKTVPSYNSKEAHNHSFTWKTANWGWAQFARRDSVFYQSMPVKSQDAFVIICTITSSPFLPPTHVIPRQPVPKALLDTVGALLDDPLYSDVQFIIPKRGQSISNGWRIWASKRLLQRADYFQTSMSSLIYLTRFNILFLSVFNSNFAEGSVEPKTSIKHQEARPKSSEELDDGRDSSQPDEHEHLLDSSNPLDEGTILLSDSHSADWDRLDPEGIQSTDSHASSPQIQPTTLNSIPRQQDTSSSSSSKMTIVVKDAAYTTYRAMLYYIYTDNIVFAPLSSSFLHPSTPSEGSQVPGARRFSTHDLMPSRADWIREWTRNNPGRPAPCSAKSIYRIADKLKERAAQHITKSLTVENIAYEVFSPFAAAFDAIRKVEIEFFLSHWQEIRASDTMKNHPGFEEVIWPVIVQSLEFKPSPPVFPHPRRVMNLQRNFYVFV
ncbi:hypothetical protein BDZ97DRAFT_1904491 [Flammula alnicola]|nr:hypothetical protein BDZ97DRAFT_1904491 [Flammula alnicola]